MPPKYFSNMTVSFTGLALSMPYSMNASFFTQSGRGAILTFFTLQARKRAAACAQLLSKACKRQVIGRADFKSLKGGTFMA